MKAVPPKAAKRDMAPASKPSPLLGTKDEAKSNLNSQE